MANMIIVYWRDIPAQVVISAGRKKAKRQLSERFQEAIDLAAMRSKAHETDIYLEEWRRSPPTECGDDLEAEADRVADELEKQFNNEDLDMIATNGGHTVG